MNLIRKYIKLLSNILLFIFSLTLIWGIYCFILKLPGALDITIASTIVIIIALLMKYKKKIKLNSDFR